MCVKIDEIVINYIFVVYIILISVIISLDDIFVIISNIFVRG